jgi:multicomponent Na+:H+ antiporter subunit F
MIHFTVFALIIAMFAMLWRVVKGKTDFDRILAANLFGTKTVGLIVVISLIFNDEMLIDIAFVYALVNFITTIGFMRYFAGEDKKA